MPWWQELTRALPYRSAWLLWGLPQVHQLLLLPFSWYLGVFRAPCNLASILGVKQSTTGALKCYCCSKFRPTSKLELISSGVWDDSALSCISSVTWINLSLGQQLSGLIVRFQNNSQRVLLGVDVAFWPKKSMQ